MSSSYSQLNVTPEALRLVAEGLSSELLPEKSKERYIGQFRILKSFSLSHVHFLFYHLLFFFPSEVFLILICLNKIKKKKENSVERDCILLYPYLYQRYRNPLTLFFGDHLISSSVGAQQGDPCGPMIFSLAIQPIILSLDSQLNIWYLDDGTLADYPEVVLSDFKKVINLSRKIGLELNFSKCEIFCCPGDTDLKVIKEFQNLAPGIKICDRGRLSLLGSPIFDQGFENTVEKTIITVENLLNKAEADTWLLF
jgi:hypothetical protein